MFEWTNVHALFVQPRDSLRKAAKLFFSGTHYPRALRVRANEKQQLVIADERIRIVKLRPRQVTQQPPDLFRFLWPKFSFYFVELIEQLPCPLTTLVG